VTARRGITATDRLMLGYLALNTAVLLARAGRIESWPWLLAGNALTVALITMLGRATPTRFVTFMGAAYPVILTLGFYTQIGVINGELGLVYDQAVHRWETALFGSQVSVTWHRTMPGALLSWVLHFCYGSYYWIVGVPLLFLALRRRGEAFDRGCFLITLGFYVCYAIYLFYPVAGPRYFFGVATGPAAEVLPARIVHGLLEGGSAWGTAFPSSHIAASWCSAAAVWREARRLSVVLWVMAVGLALGTVYGQFHYGVDALAGAALAVALLAAGDPLRRRLGVAAAAA